MKKKKNNGEIMVTSRVCELLLIVVCGIAAVDGANCGPGTVLDSPSDLCIPVRSNRDSRTQHVSSIYVTDNNELKIQAPSGGSTVVDDIDIKRMRADVDLTLDIRAELDAAKAEFVDVMLNIRAELDAAKAELERAVAVIADLKSTTTTTTITTTTTSITETSTVSSTTVSSTTVSSTTLTTITTTTAAKAGQKAYIKFGTFTFTPPPGVTSVHVVVVGPSSKTGDGAGQQYGTSGGALGWKNNIQVTPGHSYKVVVGRFGGQDSSFQGCVGGAGVGQGRGSVGGKVSGCHGGGNGGKATCSGPTSGGGGGAGGYDGDGGNGGCTGDGNPGDGGGGGGGGSACVGQHAGGGGGVGLLGKGANGNSGGAGCDGWGGEGGGGGSGGATGGKYGNGGNGQFGGGGGGYVQTGHGAVRIIWGESRSFPNNAGDV